MNFSERGGPKSGFELGVLFRAKSFMDQIEGVLMLNITWFSIAEYLKFIQFPHLNSHQCESYNFELYMISRRKNCRAAAFSSFFQFALNKT